MMIDSLSTTAQGGDGASGAAASLSPVATRNQLGFTLVEVIAVMVLVGIMSAIVFTHVFKSGVDAELSGAAEVVKSHLRFAQTLAMNSDVSWGINFNGSTYTLKNASAVTASLPTDVPQGVTFSSTVNPLMFDNRWGSPGDSEITVKVSKGGMDRSFTVTANTGFIP